MMSDANGVLRAEVFDIDNPEVMINSKASRVQILESTDGKSRVEIHGPEEAGAKYLSEIEIEQRGRKLKVRLEKTKGGIREFFANGKAELSVSVWLPANSTVEVNCVSGDVEIQSVVKELDVKTVSGDVTILQNPTKVCSVKTVSGDVLAMTQSSCNYDFKSVSGDVKVFVVPGLEIDVDGNSVSGDLSSEIPLGGSAADDSASIGSVSIDAKSVSGDFTLARS